MLVYQRVTPTSNTVKWRFRSRFPTKPYQSWWVTRVLGGEQPPKKLPIQSWTPFLAGSNLPKPKPNQKNETAMLVGIKSFQNTTNKNKQVRSTNSTVCGEHLKAITMVHPWVLTWMVKAPYKQNTLVVCFIFGESYSRGLNSFSKPWKEISKGSKDIWVDKHDGFQSRNLRISRD